LARDREEKRKSEFHERLIEVLERQYHQYEPYGALCESEGVRLEDLKAMVRSGELHRIPAVPADWFKRGQSKGLFTKLGDFQKKGFWLVSSATGGDPSYIWRTEADRQCIVDSFCRAYEKVPKTRCLAFSPEPDFLKRAGKRFAFDEHDVEFYAVVPTITAELAFDGVGFLTRLNVPRTMWTMLKTRGKGRPVLNLDKKLLVRALEDAEQNKSQVILASSILLLYPALRSLPRTYDLGGNAFFLTGGGGWDGKKGTLVGEPIDKPTYIREMCERFGIPEDAIETNFWDTYGTAENGKAQPGPFSRELGDFIYEVGDDVKLYALDPVDGLARAGENGFPKFISPYGTEGFAGACVQQQDILKVLSLNDDGSVRQFTHIHRATCAGCALDIAEYVKI
jgi:hypothetical protein